MGAFEQWFDHFLLEHHGSSGRTTLWIATLALMSGRIDCGPDQFVEVMGTTLTARPVVGLAVPVELATRLRAGGFDESEIATFLPIAYRLQQFFERSRQSSGPMSLDEATAIARSRPTSKQEQGAIRYARSRGPAWLKRTLVRCGHRWEPVFESLVANVVDRFSKREHPREIARHLGNSLRRHGILIDTERLIRTEVARWRSAGHWTAESENWNDRTAIYRHVSSGACRECVRLHLGPDGKPRVFQVLNLRGRGGLQPNRGPRRLWVLKIGPTHDNCTCAPWARWIKDMDRVFEIRAARVRERMRSMGLETIDG